MFRLRNLIVGVVLTLLVACGDDSSTTPTAPSSVPSVVQSNPAPAPAPTQTMLSACFEVTPNVATAGTQVRLDANCSSPASAIATYMWELGDGRTRETTAPVIFPVYRNAGNFTPRLTVIGPNAVSDTAERELTIESGPTAGGGGPAGGSQSFAFTLPAGSQGSVVVGPVLAGSGPLTVTLNFSGNFIILACVGTQVSCIPMGGTPQTRTFNIPSDFPAGAIQAQVYFNPNFPQAPGNASGTVRFTYVPQ